MIELEDAPEAGPQDVAAVPDVGFAAPEGRAMQVVATLGARRPSHLARLFWGALVALITFIASVAAWDYVTGLLAANPTLGWIATGLIGAVVFALLLIALRELAAFARLGRLDQVHRAAEAALATGDVGGAREVARQIVALYAARPELRDGRARLEAERDAQFDPAALFALTEAEVLAPLDAAAAQEAEVAARQVATATALIPLAFADVIAALTANLRMIRRIAEIYGGRAGTLGSWRLTRAVMTHLVATGAVAIGDDLLGSAVGGSGL